MPSSVFSMKHGATCRVSTRNSENSGFAFRPRSRLRNRVVFAGAGRMARGSAVGRPHPRRDATERLARWGRRPWLVPRCALRPADATLWPPGRTSWRARAGFFSRARIRDSNSSHSLHQYRHSIRTSSTGLARPSFRTMAQNGPPGETCHRLGKSQHLTNYGGPQDAGPFERTPRMECGESDNTREALARGRAWGVTLTRQLRAEASI
jgi:hypothetical protein